jgi:acyl-CoA reductase-like NAD-dependent aldehyde dehydrogenase
MAQSTSKKTTRKKTTRRRSSGPAKLKSFNPRSGEVMREVTTTPPIEIPEIVGQARKVQPEWAAISPQGRAHIMKQVRYRLNALIDDLVETVAAEAGKPPAEALAHEVMPVAVMLTYLEKAAPRALRSEHPMRLLAPVLGATSRVDYKPFGVVGAITPWNYPITNCFLAFAPALFAGNAVVVKPSEVTPGCGELIREILDPLPPGVATVVQGGADVGAALVDAPCDKISFIGSPPTGRKICEAAAQHLTPVVMELGGVDAAVVCEDADLDYTASGVVWGSFFNAGQTCSSLERVYVTDSVADEFKDRVLSKLSQVKQGDEVGPLTFKPQFDKVGKQIDDAVKKGSRVIVGGPEEGIRNKNGSLWYAPTVVEDPTEDAQVLTEESFGPILTLVRVRDEDEAIRRANEDAVNLTASVWTSDKRRADDIAARLRSGVVTVNHHGDTAATPWAPWGGVGTSGFGRLNGFWGLREFTYPVHVSHNIGAPRMKRLWWYPYDEASNQSLRGVSEALTAPTLEAKLEGAKKLFANVAPALRSKL